MQYLLGQMLLCLLGAALLGVIFGWAWWGMRLRQAHEQASVLEQRLSKLAGYPARLTDMEATHAAYVASKTEEEAKAKLLAAKIPELQQSLAAKTTDADVLRTQLAALQTEFKNLGAQHKSALEDSTAKEARLASLATRITALEQQISYHVDANKEKDEHLEQLITQVDDLKASHAKKDAQIAHLAEPAAQGHTREQIAELVASAALVPALKVEVEQQASKVAELEPMAAMVPSLKAEVERHAAAYAEKDAQIARLAVPAEPTIQSHTPEQIAGLAATAALVPTLKAEIEQHATKVAELQPLATMVPSLQAEVERQIAGHAEKDVRIGALLSRVEELQTTAAQTEETQYEKGRTVATAPLKAMAAAAGAGSRSQFYDVNEGVVAPPAAPAQDHVAEFEKRIEDMRGIESAKDAEIKTLRSKIIEIEAAPDPDVRRQILFAAKNAEVTQLKGVLNSLLQPVNQGDIALRAYHYAEQRGFVGGSENEDWLRAERDIHFSRLAAAWDSTRPAGTMF